MPAADKRCPYCGQEISLFAKKCGRCGKYIDEPLKDETPVDSVDRFLLPVGRPLSAIAAGYVGLFSLFPILGIVPGVLAVLLGLAALKTIGKNPNLSGRGRAWFGIIVGGLMATLQFISVIIYLLTPHVR